MYLCWDKPSHVFFTTFFTTFFFARIIFCVKNNLLRNFLVVNLVVISILTIFIIYKYGDISTSMVMSTLGVNLGVSYGTIKTFGLSFLLLFLFVLCLTIFLAINISHANYSRKERTILIVAIFILLGKPISNGINEWGLQFYANNIKYSPTFISQPYLDQYKILFGITISALSIYSENAVNSYKYDKKNHNETPEFIKFDATKKKIKNIIYVIGESSNPERYGIYGYTKNTTPNLSLLKEQNKLCVIDRVHSPAAQTRLAVPMLTSLETPSERDNLFNYKNLIELAKSASYKTHWFDAQMQKNMWNKPFGYIAQYADVLQTPEGNNTGFEIKEGEDENLVPAIEHYFKESKEHNFFVIHLMGNHLPYGSFQKRPPVEFPDPYDTSVYQVDYILNKILSLANIYLKDYQFVYVSDHGEVVGAGHGFPTTENEMYKVPLIMTQSDFCKRFSQHRRGNDYISTNLLKYTILDMMGYDVSLERIKNEENKQDIILNEKEDIINFSQLKEKYIEK